jgi:hypothetical protein
MGQLETKTAAQLMKDYIVAHATAMGMSSMFNGWTFKYGKLPAEPDQVICLIDQGGPTSFPHLSVDYLGLQIIVRSIRAGDGYNSSRLMADRLKDIIVGMPPHPAQFLELDGVTQRGQIVPLGFDDQDRHLWSGNYQLLVEPEASVLSHRASL